MRPIVYSHKLGSLPERIRAALGAAEYDSDPTLGLTSIEAQDLRLAIVEADYQDDTSLECHDLLHTYITTGRAF